MLILLKHDSDIAVSQTHPHRDSNLLSVVTTIISDPHVRLTLTIVSAVTLIAVFWLSCVERSSTASEGLRVQGDTVEVRTSLLVYEVFIVAFLTTIPLVPKHLSHRAYQLCFLGTLCSSLYSLYSQYGKPRAWNLKALQVYFQSIIASKDFIYFIYCLTFVTSHLCLKFALIPILCWSFERVAKFHRRNLSRSTLYR
ncbi:hypothetical protein JHK85_028924 [Glycine max]|nr:hypothetical protein JHK85_028924 [Glycine max]